MAAAVPVIVSTAVAVTATEVIPSTVLRSAAFADASETVTVNALLAFTSVSVTSVAKSPSVTADVIIPVVRASSVLLSATVKLSEIVTL